MKYFKRRKDAFGFAIKGLGVFFRKDEHPKIHFVATLIVLAMGFWLHISPLEWCIVALCIGGVLAIEAINSSIERLTDIASPQYLKAAGEVKDIAAAAVLIFSIVAGIVGLIIFTPKIMALL